MLNYTQLHRPPCVWELLSSSYHTNKLRRIQTNPCKTRVCTHEHKKNRSALSEMLIIYFPSMTWRVLIGLQWCHAKSLLANNLGLCCMLSNRKIHVRFNRSDQHYTVCCTDIGSMSSVKKSIPIQIPNL